MNKIFFVKYLNELIMGVALIILLLIIFWASNKGLDMTDESFYLFNYSMPKNFKMSFTSFHLIQNYLFPFVNCTIQNLRIERLILYIFSAVFFAYSSCYYLRNTYNIKFHKTNSFTLYALIIAGILLSYAFGPQTPSYNTFSTFFILASTSFFLFDLSKQQTKSKIIFIYLLIGFFCGILFLVKFPNAIFMPAIFITFYFFYNLVSAEDNLRVLFSSVYRLFLIASSYLLFHLLFWKGFRPAFQFHKDFFEYINGFNGYETNTILYIYSSSFLSIFRALMTLKFLLIIFSFVGIVWSILKKQNTVFYIFIIIQLLIVIKFKIFFAGGEFIYEQSIIYLLWTLTLIFMFLIKHKNYKTIRTKEFKKQLLFIFFLLFMPIFAVIGTSNSIQVQVIFYIPFWMFIIYLILEYDFNNKINKTIYLFITLLASVQSVNALIYHPYRIGGNLISQNQIVSVGKNDMVLVDNGFKKNIFIIDSILRKSGFKKNDYIFTYTDVLGLAYIYDYKMPSLGSVWFDAKNEVGNVKTLQLFHNTYKKVQLFFVLDKRYPFSSSFKLSLIKLGYDFDNNYKKVGEVLVNFGKDEHFLLIYAPQ